jgi:hypothetical protein
MTEVGYAYETWCLSIGLPYAVITVMSQSCTIFELNWNATYGVV